MLPEFGTELPSDYELPKVDRQAVYNIRTFSTDPRPFFERQEALSDTLFNQSRFNPRELVSFCTGINLTQELLEDSKSRTGGTIPEEISMQAISSSFISFMERHKKSDDIATDATVGLFDADQELFLGLALAISRVDTQVDPYWVLQGGAFLIQLYQHILEGKRMEKQFPN